MKEIFDNYIKNVFNNEYKQSSDKIFQFEINYKKYFPKDTEELVLDIGIGRGEMLSCMKKWGYKNYLGVDISKDLVKYCENLNLNCQLIEDTVNWLAENKNRFSVITLLDVIEHIPKEKIINFLIAIKESLKEDGKVIIQTPNLQAYEGFLHRYNDFTHEVGFIEQSLREVLIVTGFLEVEIYGFETIIRNGIKQKAQKFFRNIFWNYLKFLRNLTGNICGGKNTIMNPVFFSIAKK